MKADPAPEPPYYAAIFTARTRDVDLRDYREGLEFLTAKARDLPGFLGEDAIRSEDGRLLSVSYWRDAESLRAWSRDPDHVRLKGRGRRDVYAAYELRIARVERDSRFSFEGEEDR